MNASIEPQWEAFDTEFWNTSIEVTKEQITYYEDFIRKIYNYKQQKVASRRRWYKHQQENYWCNLTYEEQIKYYEDIISEVDYDVFLDLTLKPSNPKPEIIGLKGCGRAFPQRILFRCYSHLFDIFVRTLHATSLTLLS